MIYVTAGVAALVLVYLFVALIRPEWFGEPPMWLLPPHITLDNARYQLDRVAAKWAENTKRDPARVRHEIDQILREKTWAPLGGAVGEKLVNVLEVNLELRIRYGAPAR